MTVRYVMEGKPDDTFPAAASFGVGCNLLAPLLTTFERLREITIV